MPESTPADPEKPSDADGRCRYCGEVHGDSFLEKVLAFIHLLLYILTTLFG